MVESQSSAQDDRAEKRPAGIAAFTSRVLEQLGVTSWLPAAMLIGVGAVLVELYTLNTLSVAEAVQTLANPESWGIVIVLLFALVLATMVTQAFSFGIIRALEGYWPSNWVVDAIVRRRVGAKVAEGRRVKEKVAKLDRRLFESARQRLLQEEDRDHIDVWEAQVYAIPKEYRRQKDPVLIAEANEIEWREKADPAISAIYSRAQGRVGDFPRTESRYLPTDLGNNLRASEERLGLKGSALERFVMENYNAFPTRLMAQHDQFRDRLDMYSLLVLIFTILAVAAVLLLSPWSERPVPDAIDGTVWASAWPWTPPAIAFLLFVWLASLSYRAAIASARGYGSTLVSMKAAITSANAKQPTQAVVPPSPTN